MARAPSIARIIRIILICAVCALTLSTPGSHANAAADPILVPDVSSRTIDIKYSFSGEELLLFGAIVYPDGRTPDDRADIVVVIKGPTQPIRLREKQRLAGIWVNAESVQFGSAPGYYAVAASRPIDEMLDERTSAIYEIGLSSLSLSPTEFEDSAQIDRFSRGLVDLRRRQTLYVEAENAVEITRGSLYRTRLMIPAQVPVGTYTAETFLISRGSVIAVASREIDIRKTGFDRFVALAAENYGLFYGLAAVALSLGLGWLAGWAFRKF